MRAVLLILLVACGGPGQQQLAETPTAQTPRAPSLAPPASNDDEERYRVNEQFEQMHDAEQAHREANREAAPPPPPPGQQPLPPSGAPGETPPKKKGPAEQAPPRPKKK